MPDAGERVNEGEAGGGLGGEVGGVFLPAGAFVIGGGAGVLPERGARCILKR